MNVGILRNTFLPPSETFIYNQIKYLESFDIQILTREVSSQEIFDLNHLEINSVVDKKETPLKQQLDKVGYTFTRRTKVFQNAVVNKRINLIHAHFGVDAVYALPVTKKYNIPLVTTFHGMDITRLPKFTLLPISWMNYYLHFNELKENGEMFIAVSSYIKKQLIKHGFPKEKIKVHYIGIDVDNIRFNNIKNNDEVTVLSVGRLAEKKGIKYLIDAFEKLYQKNKKVKLVIVGDGPLKKELRDYAHSLKAKEKIVFKGHLKNETVINEMLNSDIFCMPSITANDGDQEGLGMVQLEAAATGLPVIASNSGGISDGIVDGATGFLFEEKNINQLEEKLKKLCADRELRETMGKKARENVEENFNLKVQSKKLEELYKELLG